MVNEEIEDLIGKKISSIFYNESETFGDKQGSGNLYIIFEDGTRLDITPTIEAYPSLLDLDIDIINL